MFKIVKVAPEVNYPRLKAGACQMKKREPPKKGKGYDDDHDTDNPDCTCFGCNMCRIREVMYG